MITAGIFICLCLASAFNYYRTRRQRKLIKNLKGPFTFPLIGSFQKILFLTPKNFFKRSSDYLSKFGNLTRCWLFYRLFIPVADWELAKQLLQSESHLETGYELMSDWLGGGVLMCQPEQWQQRHQQLVSFFRPENMLQLKQMVQQVTAQICLEMLPLAATREVCDVRQLVSSKVLDLILATTCGMQPSEQYKQAVTDLSQLYRQRFLGLKSANRIIFCLTAPIIRMRQKRLIRKINAEFKQMLEQCQQQSQTIKQTKTEGIVIDRFEPTPRIVQQSLLDVLLQSESLTTEQICDELNTCNFLGYLLCSTTLCFALVMIARHPSVQQRCLEELSKASSAETDWSQLSLPYLEAVLKETLRLQPPQVILGRQLKEDFAYTHSVVGDGTLPAGAEIYLNLYELQRSEQQYGNTAQQFQPERFLDPSLELLSFSLGPRSCPAQQFSLSLLKSLLAPLLLQFELLPYGNDMQLNLELVLGSRNGFQLAFKPR